MPDTAKFRKLKNALFRRCEENGLRAARWPVPRNRTSHVLEIDKVLLYIKDSALDHGWWGINRNVYEKLKNSGRDWRLVLLVRQDEDGYLFSNSEVAVMVPGSSENRDSYIVNEQKIVRREQFHSFAELFSGLGL